MAQWEEVVSKRAARELARVPQLPKASEREEKQPVKDEENKKQPMFRQMCNCCLLPGRHFVDKCTAKARADAFADRKKQKEQRDLERQERHAAWLERQERHAAWLERQERHGAWERNSNMRRAKTKWSQEEWDQWRSQWRTRERSQKDAERPEQADDASTVASLSLDTMTAPLQHAVPEQVVTAGPEADVSSPRSGTSGEWDAPVSGKWVPWDTPVSGDWAPAPAAAIGVADELRKLAELMREGILTDEEFQVQKKRLLS